MGMNIGLSDGENPNKGYQLYIVSTVMVILAGLCVLARLAARWAKRSYGYDDYAIIASLTCSVPLSVMINLAVVDGYGRHKSSLKKQELGDALMYFYIAQVFYKPVIGLNKTSILCLYLRIFVGKAFRMACYVNLAVVGALTVGATIATMLQCIPIAAAWDKSMDATCTNTIAFWYAWCVLNILTDAVILFLPVREVLKLQLPRREKFGLLAVFSLGAFVTVSSVIRATAVANSTYNQADITWNFISRGIWTLIEANTGIICASLPMLYKPASTIFPSLRRNISIKSGKYYSKGSYPKSPHRTVTGWTLPDGTVVPPSAAEGGYRKQESGRREAWDDDDEEYPLGPVPMMGGNEAGKHKGIVRKVDVDVTYQDSLGRAVTTGAREPSMKEHVEK